MTRILETPFATRGTLASVTMAGALNQALADALAGDERVRQDRVMDTPLAEAGIIGTAIGMAMNGLRPVVEMQFDAFAYPAFEQITSHLAKLHNRTRGRIELPVVVRIPYGGGIGGVEHHCDSSEAYYTHTPGLRVVTPGSPSDAYRLLQQAIACPDPVIFLEPKRRYWAKEQAILTADGPGLDQAVIRRAGSDVTLIAYGGLVATALEAAQAGQDEGWDIEVIDLRSLAPFDDDTVASSVRRTGRAVVIHEASGFGGYGAEVAARLSEQCFHYLAAPILRVTGFDIPYPPLKFEGHHLPSVDRILDAIERLQWDDQWDDQRDDHA
jgi:pyruvate dehydrogenase E1 component beta subunit